MRMEIRPRAVGVMMSTTVVCYEIYIFSPLDTRTILLYRDGEVRQWDNGLNVQRKGELESSTLETPRFEDSM